jgi:cell fate (sporulation/competence/biofilm development) regulator YlbF (YheA/YmcA/DUF963 family)
MADDAATPADLDEQIRETAAKLGELVAQHPAIAKYAEARDALRKDAEAGRLMQEFQQKAMTVARNEQYGQPVTQTERQELERMQATIASNLRVKAFSIAETDMTDVLRKASQIWQKPVAKAQGQDEEAGGGGGAPGGLDAGGMGGGFGGLVG